MESHKRIENLFGEKINFAFMQKSEKSHLGSILSFLKQIRVTRYCLSKARVQIDSGSNT